MMPAGHMGHYASSRSNTLQHRSQVHTSQITWVKKGESRFSGADQDPRIKPGLLLDLLDVALIVVPVLGTLDLQLHFLYLLSLSCPLLLPHLGLAAEQLLVRLTVAAAQAVPQSGELAVVVVEVQMVHRMTGGAIDEGRVGDVFTVVCGKGV